MTTVRIEQIAIDAGTQIRAAINEQVVVDYADRMTEGVQFPPVVLFHDGNGYFLADGFHRVMAATRNQFRDIAADVRLGTKADALWFALGANRENAHRMTGADKKHAVLLAVKTWPDMTQHKIAEQIGCSQGLVSQVITTNNLHDLRNASVTGTDGKRYPTSRQAEEPHPKHGDIVQRLKAGEPVHAIAKATQVNVTKVTEIRKAAGLEFVDKSRDAVLQRRKDVTDLAASGHSTPQIAAALGLSDGGVRAIVKELGITVAADRVVKNSRRHDATRIVESIVMDAENLTSDVNLIDFAALDVASVARWVDSLTASEKSLSAFIRRLRKEMSRVQVA